MTARPKPNAARVQVALVIATVFGFLVDSWIVVVIVACLLIAAGIHDGSIRK